MPRLSVKPTGMNFKQIDFPNTGCNSDRSLLRLTQLATDRSSRNKKVTLGKLLVDWRIKLMSESKIERELDDEFNSKSSRASFQKKLEIANALLALGKCKKHYNFPVFDILENIITGNSICQSKIYLTTLGEPINYLCWAWISEYTINRLKSDPNVVLHMSEWNEGDALYFRVISIGNVFNNEVALDIGARLFPKANKVFLNLFNKTTRTPELVEISRAERSDLRVWYRKQHAIKACANESIG
jgi:hemolysin-activating ACP:hemolysin acyltransferase